MRSRSSATVIASGAREIMRSRSQAAEDHRDLLDAPGEVVLQALRVLVGHLDLAHAAARAHRIAIHQCVSPSSCDDTG